MLQKTPITSSSKPAEISDVTITWRGEPWPEPQIEMKINGSRVVILTEQKQALIEAGALVYNNGIDATGYPTPPLALSIGGRRIEVPGAIKSPRIMKHWLRLIELAEDLSHPQEDQILEQGPFKLAS